MLPLSLAQDKEAHLQADVRSCKADVLDYMNRARKISEHNRGPTDEETVRITKLVANLAEKFAHEESARVGHDILDEPEEEDEMSPTRKKAAQQVCVHAAFLSRGCAPCSRKLRRCAARVRVRPASDLGDAHVQTEEWLAKQGIDAEEWGLGGGSTSAPSAHDNTDRIISFLRAK